MKLAIFLLALVGPVLSHQALHDIDDTHEKQTEALQSGDLIMRQCAQQCSVSRDGGVNGDVPFAETETARTACNECIKDARIGQIQSCEQHEAEVIPAHELNNYETASSALAFLQSHAGFDPNQPLISDEEGECVGKAAEHIVIVGNEYQEGKFPYVTGAAGSEGTHVVGGPVVTQSLQQCEQLCMLMSDCEYGTFVTKTVEEGHDTGLVGENRYREGGVFGLDEQFTHNHGRTAQQGECWLSRETHESRVACGVPCVGFRKETVQPKMSYAEQKKQHFHRDLDRVDKAGQQTVLGGACYISAQSDECCKDSATCWNGKIINRTVATGGAFDCAFDFHKHCDPKPPCNCDPELVSSAFTRCRHDVWTDHIIVNHLPQRFHGAPMTTHQQHRCKTTGTPPNEKCSCCDCDPAQDHTIADVDGFHDLGQGMHLVGKVLKEPMQPCPVSDTECVPANYHRCVQMCASDSDCTWGTYSPSQGACFIGKAAPDTDLHGRFVQKKCPELRKHGEEDCIYNLHESDSGECSSDMEDHVCHSFSFDERARTFLKDSRNSLTFNSAGHNDRPSYKFCQWVGEGGSDTVGECKFNQDPRFDRPKQAPRLAEHYSSPTFRWPFVQHDVVQGWTQDQCLASMKQGHNVQWRCDAADNAPFKIIELGCSDYTGTSKAMLIAQLRQECEAAFQDDEDKLETCNQHVAQNIVETDAGTFSYKQSQLLCGERKAGMCTGGCSEAEVAYQGSAIASTTAPAHTKNVFGCQKRFPSGHCPGQWQVAQDVGATPFIGYKFDEAQAITRIAFHQYWRSGTCVNRGCCGNTIAKTQKYRETGKDAQVVQTFCEDDEGTRKNYYCKNLQVEYKDTNNNWINHDSSGTLLQFYGQIGYNTFSFSGVPEANSWRLRCMDGRPQGFGSDIDSSPDMWTIDSQGIQLYGAEEGCSNDGLGVRQWLAGDAAYAKYGSGCEHGCCVAGCACKIGCSAVTEALDDIATSEAECNNMQDKHGSQLVWDSTDQKCKYTKNPQERCEETQDHLTLDKAGTDSNGDSNPVTDAMGQKCQQNQYYRQNDGNAECIQCAQGQYQSATGHYLQSCSLCPTDVDENATCDNDANCHDQCS